MAAEAAAVRVKTRPGIAEHLRGSSGLRAAPRLSPRRSAEAGPGLRPPLPAGGTESGGIHPGGRRAGAKSPAVPWVAVASPQTAVVPSEPSVPSAGADTNQPPQSTGAIAPGHGRILNTERRAFSGLTAWPACPRHVTGCGKVSFSWWPYPPLPRRSCAWNERGESQPVTVLP